MLHTVCCGAWLICSLKNNLSGLFTTNSDFVPSSTTRPAASTLLKLLQQQFYFIFTFVFLCAFRCRPWRHLPVRTTKFLFHIFHAMGMGEHLWSACVEYFPRNVPYRSATQQLARALNINNTLKLLCAPEYSRCPALPRTRIPPKTTYLPKVLCLGDWLPVDTYAVVRHVLVLLLTGVCVVGGTPCTSRKRIWPTKHY